jgi:hemerythrin-like domain-containing protein
MGIQIGARPDSGFDDPIGMLRDCHRRVEHFLQILCVVAERAPGRALTQEEITAVQSAKQYFRVGGKRHTADEEDSLFPRLRAQSPAAAMKEIARLEIDHRHSDGLHARVDSLYALWIANGRLSAEDEQLLIVATRHLKQMYDEHIEVEEKIVFPRAAEVLDAQAIAAIGEEFRARRSE